MSNSLNVTKDTLRWVSLVGEGDQKAEYSRKTQVGCIIILLLFIISFWDSFSEKKNVEKNHLAKPYLPQGPKGKWTNMKQSWPNPDPENQAVKTWIASKAFPSTRPNVWEKGLFQSLVKGGKWSIFLPSLYTRVHGWQGPFSPSPFRPQSTLPTEKWTSVTFSDITSLPEVTYLGLFNILL